MGMKLKGRDKTPVPDEVYDGSPSVVWNGHLYDYSGYGKSNREILFRVANVLKVSTRKTGLEYGLISVDKRTRARCETFLDATVHERAPYLRFFGPDYCKEPNRHKIIWTMMETYKIHHDIVARINGSYDELWTPTAWNAEVFKDSGVKVPARVMKLGANPWIYRPMGKQVLPNCKLVSARSHGQTGVPHGFTFITLGLPSFRKGYDVLADAFEMAFEGRDDVHLVVAVTHSLKEWNEDTYKIFWGRKAHIWALEGQFSEHGLAQVYNACNAYVSASRGEGWNLPVSEAAACGLPVVVPNNTSHPEVVEDNGFYFQPEGTALVPNAERISEWYTGMPFSSFGKKSVKDLAAVMESVVDGGAEVRRRSRALTKRTREDLTWDHAANAVLERLMEVQP